MTTHKVNGYFESLKDAYRKPGTVTSFILINGFILAVVCFSVLFLSVGNQQEDEARSVTRDLLRNTEQSIADMEKTARGLGYFYASLSNLQDSSQVSTNVQQLLADDSQILGLLWTTQQGAWQQQDIIHKMDHSSFDPTLGWPGFQELYKLTFNHDFNAIEYMSKLPWSAFNDRVLNPQDVPVGLTMKLRLPDGSVGILMLVTTPERIFGSSWSTQRKDIAGISIRDRETGSLMLDNHIYGGQGGYSSLSVKEVNYVLQLGDKMWDIRFEVYPTMAATLLSWSPWISFLMLFIMTAASSYMVERRHRQDVKLAEMSRTLEGAHNELQNKISERDRLFHALRKSERENRAVINSVSDVIFETDENGRLVFLNETWKRITNLDTAETMGKSLFSMIEPTERGRQHEMFEELVRGERQAYRAETRLDLGQGISKPVEVAFSMLRMAEDKSIRVVGTITDIEKRRRAEMALREAEQRFRAIFENSISGIYQTSPEGRFISANPALAEILGYSTPEEMIQSVTDISTQIYIHPEERSAYVQKLLFEGKAIGIESEVRRKDGKKIWILENARVVRTERGGVHYYEGSIWDVTERKEAEEAMRQARLQAEISSRSRMEFLANMSHELRTPLNAVIGFSEIIKDEIMGPISVPAYKEYAQDIYESGNYLLKVISEILEVSRIETGNRELNLSSVKLSKALKACMTIMSSRIDESGVTVKSELPEIFPELMAEELGFKQIMLNLIGNAIKFTPKGGLVTIQANLNQNGEMVVDITDNGIGMTEDEIVKAMQPFSKVDNNFSTMKAGTGLGLTIVDSLVRLHSGQFKLISQKGVGTTARVTMPAFRVLPLPEGVMVGASGHQLKVVK